MKDLKKNILLLESVSDEAMTLLEENTCVFSSTSPHTGSEIAHSHPIHAIITRGKGDVSEVLIRACPDLQIIARCGVGLDNVDVNFATTQGVKVINAPGSNADTVAEHTLGLMLMLQRSLYNAVQAVKKGNWNFRTSYQGDELRGKTLGILGFGDIGSRVAKLAEAFGMKIIFWSKTAKENPYFRLPLPQVLKRSDIVSIHLPLTTETKHLINAGKLELMKSHALLINTARGAIIEKEALIEALKNRQIGGFAADVLEIQPPGHDDPLLSMPNVLITPHAASLTATTYNEMCTLTVQNTLDLLNGKPINEKYIFNRNELK